MRELFVTAAPTAKRKTRGDLFKRIDADYYGYRDDEDGILLPLEAEVGDFLHLRLNFRVYLPF